MLPPPRFTAAGALFGGYNSFLFVHGGYSSQEGTAIENMAGLDLAPALGRDIYVLDEDYDFEGFAPVNGDDGRHHHFGHHFGHHGTGIGGMEDLLQNLFVELAGGRMGGGMGAVGMRGGPPPHMAAQMVGDILGELAGVGGRRGPDEESDDDEDDDDDDDMGPGGGRAALMLSLLANGAVMFVSIWERV